MLREGNACYKIAKNVQCEVSQMQYNLVAFVFFKSDPRVDCPSNLYSKISILWHIDTFCKECAVTPSKVPDPLVQVWPAPRTQIKQETHSNCHHV